ncbi:MAG: Putative oxidoreductase, partial [uncultured Nocardioidaceae bacterium]
GAAGPSAARGPTRHGAQRALGRRLPPRGVGGQPSRRRGLRRAADVHDRDHAGAGRRRRRVDAPPGRLAQGGVRVRVEDRHPGVRRGGRRLPAAHARVDGQAQGRRRDRPADEPV